MDRQGLDIGNQGIHFLEVDQAVVRHLLQHTQYVGEPLLSILKRLLGLQKTVQSISALERKSRGNNLPLKDRRFEAVEQLLLSASQNRRPSGSVVWRFLKLLEAMHRVDSALFWLHAAHIRGRKRRYFGRSAEEIFETGRRTNPLLIPNTSIWVVTNNSSDRKHKILQQLATRMGIPKVLQDQFATYLHGRVV